MHDHNGFIRDICDGHLYKTHPLFSRDAKALQLMLYYDELEIANPLGSKTGKHKLGKPQTMIVLKCVGLI